MDGVFVFVLYFFEEVVVEAQAARTEASSTPIVYISSNGRLVSNVPVQLSLLARI